MKPFEHGGNVYDAGDCNEELLDFSANINPLGLSEQVKKAIMNNMENLVHYPDPSGAKLKQVISVYYGTHPENIILGNGAVELLYIYFHSQRNLYYNICIDTRQIIFRTNLGIDFLI